MIKEIFKLFCVAFSLIFLAICGTQAVGNHALSIDKLDIQSRISGGDLAADNQFPYQAGLNIELEGSQFTWCGGSLISKQWILTAAHCVDDIVAVVVYLGSIYRLQPDKTFKLPLSNINLHHSFNRNTLENDIALLRLPSTVSLTTAIHPVTLPKRTAVYSTYAYHEAIASGWGRENDSTSTISNCLRYVVRYTLSNAECQFVYGSSVRTTNICIDTTGGKSTCSGDSGGPLVVYDAADGLIQIGLTSFGKSSGCTKGHPAVFTRLTAYLDWIYEISGVTNM